MFGKGRNRKGSILDLFLLVAIAFAFSFFILIGYKLSYETNQKIQSMDVFSGTEARTAGNQLVSYYPGAIDNSFLLVVFGFAIVTLILASLVRVSPVFIFAFIIAWIILLFLCGIYSEAYQALAENSQLSALADNLQYVPAIMNYLPLIVAVIGILLMIVMYKNWRDA